MAEVPDGDHLMRFVPLGQQIRDPDTEEFRGIANTAFEIRPTDDGGLSLTWVEHYGPKTPKTHCVAAVAFRETLKSKKLPTKAYFAIGQAGRTRTVAADHGKKIRIVHSPDGANTGHVELRRFSDEDRRLLDALALDVYVEHISVVSLKLR